MGAELSEIKRSELWGELVFLSFGFGWDDIRVQEIYDFMLSSNMELGIYGYRCVDRGATIGCILLMCQGSYKGRKVVNLASFYMIPSRRANDGGRFFFEVVSHLINGNFVITDYTPTKNVEKALVLMGFTKMRCKQIVPYLPTGGKLRSLLRSLWETMFHGLDLGLASSNIEHGVGKTGVKYASHYELRHCRKKSERKYLRVGGCFIRRRIVGVNVRIYRIYYASCFKTLAKYWMALQILMLLREGALITAIIPEGEDKYFRGMRLRRLSYYIAGASDGLYISPVGSEIGFNRR